MTPNTLINGDVLTVLRQMESESVDFIITDPPYIVGVKLKEIWG